MQIFFRTDLSNFIIPKLNFKLCIKEEVIFMTKLTYDNSAQLCLLKEEDVQNIHKTALKILAEVGVYFDTEEALRLLAVAGKQ